MRLLLDAVDAVILDDIGHVQPRGLSILVGRPAGLLAPVQNVVLFFLSARTAGVSSRAVIVATLTARRRHAREATPSALTPADPWFYRGSLFCPS